MADIAKCTGVSEDKSVCTRKSTCYRYTANVSEFQVYMTQFYDIKNGCKFYWGVGNAN